MTQARAARLIDAIGAELAAAPFAQQTQGGPLASIPAPSEAEAARRSGLAREWRRALEVIEPKALPAAIRGLLGVAAATIERLEREERWYWLVHDPLGLGFFGLFGPTPYAGGWHLSVVGGLLAREAARRPGDGERLLALVRETGEVVRAMRARLLGQAARSILMPEAQRTRAAALVAATGPRLLAQIAAMKQDGNPPAFAARLDQLVEQEVEPALAALAAAVADAPVTDRVGMSALPGAAAVYAELVRHHLTLDLGPDEVHAIATARLAAIRDVMAALRSEVGFAGDDAAFAAHLARAPGQRATDARDVVRVFDRVLDRVRPRLDRWFHERPGAPFGAAALPAELEAGMTFGIYKVPASPSATGQYLFNAHNMVASGTMRVAALAYHELAPGHHIHLAGQAADEGLPALVRYNSFNAFNEGWAEYAAGLAGEEGLYVTPAERFGRAMMDAFLTARLIADIGLNARGWSLARAQAFLTEHAFMSVGEAVSEAIRYAADQPAQVLAYKLGDTFLFEQRERLRVAAGARFDLRDFHRLVLAGGARPLPLVAADVDAALGYC